MRGPSLKLIDYGSSRRVVTKGGDVGEMVGTAEFMGIFVFLHIYAILTLSAETFVFINFRELMLLENFATSV